MWVWLVGVVGVGVLVPLGVGRSFADQKADALAARKQLGQQAQPASTIRLVAKALRPSVVSIRSTNVVKTAQAPHPWFNRDDPFMRRFFGDDMFERFFRDTPRGGRGYRQHGIGSAPAATRSRGTR